ncbi:MAG: PLDc N-terminal domain-containing protein [Candidatus Lokiarchaeota archaeon]|nr:PLDc N-terminal domain-containing protein [Candidatus Lokiarchaeota archaeon]
MTLPFDPFAGLAFIYLIMIILVVVYYIIGLLIAIWVYRDAKKRDMNAAVWLLIVLLTGCIGCIIYLVVRKD